MQSANFNSHQVIFLNPLFYFLLLVCWQLADFLQISFVKNNQDWLVFEERFNCMEKMNLLQN